MRYPPKQFEESVLCLKFMKILFSCRQIFIKDMLTIRLLKANIADKERNKVPDFLSTLWGQGGHVEDSFSKREMYGDGVGIFCRRGSDNSD